MNRDEAITRAPELPPRVMEHSDHCSTWLAPLDGNAGGTWIGTNEHQLHACLLNQYGPSDADFVPQDGSRPSRGQIIADLMGRRNALAARQWLQREFNPAQFPPFLLIVMDPRTTHSITWDRNALGFTEHHAEWLMFSSSSWRTEEVLAYRRNEFETWVEAGAEHIRTIPSFHLLQPEGRQEWSPLMQRSYAATRSVTQIEVSSSLRQTEMRYWSRLDLEHLESPARTLCIEHRARA